ncbi:hypothetical protein F5X99DRAFT_409514 [Biscogniauxia marginata]|nr:hypothetical protein F5X99DRAFT_409514 [Biscogniauxia marginata]
MNRLSVLFGLAMVDHLDSKVDLALNAWQVALAASRECLSTGYTDMVISYSTTEPVANTTLLALGLSGWIFSGSGSQLLELTLSAE